MIYKNFNQNFKSVVKNDLFVLYKLKKIYKQTVITVLFTG